MESLIKFSSSDGRARTRRSSSRSRWSARTRRRRRRRSLVEIRSARGEDRIVLLVAAVTVPLQLSFAQDNARGGQLSLVLAQDNARGGRLALREHMHILIGVQIDNR